MAAQKKDYKTTATAAASLFFTGKEKEQEQGEAVTEAPAANIGRPKRSRATERMNTAFSPEAMDYINVMSRARGMSMTQYLNLLVEQQLEENKEAYIKVKAAMEEQL